jgi:pantetheine-phosphate adenylyltransferase
MSWVRPLLWKMRGFRSREEALRTGTGLREGQRRRRMMSQSTPQPQPLPAGLNSRHAVYVGSFDPITLGHLDIIARGSRLFDRLTVGTGINPGKAPLFTPQERLALTLSVVRPYSNVDVRCFEGLTVNFVRECGAAVTLRGIRTLADLDTEFTMSLANHVLAPEIETIFLMAGEKYSHVSSTLIKQIAQLGPATNAASLAAFVPAEVIESLRAKFAVEKVGEASSGFHPGLT